jgi:protein-disulfide isomerase
MILSGWLLSQKLTGSITYLAGCGSGSGCAGVLGSRWSQWFYLPVTALSLGLYALLFAVSFSRRRSAVLSLALATCFTGAAIWFAVVQAFVLHSFCPWCLAAHLLGIGAAVILFRSVAWKDDSKAVKPGLLVGLAGLVVLVAGQVFGPVPQSHVESRVVLSNEPNAGKPEVTKPVHERGEGRVVTFLEGKRYNVAGLPHLGDPGAPHVLVEYYDYTCDYCRDQHQDLKAVLEKYPGKFCIIVLPCPISRECNPHVPAPVENHKYACELARLALACWKVEPSAFPSVHEALYARPVLDLAQTMEAIKPLLSKPLSQEALADPWINEVLAADAADYKRINVTNSGELNYMMPKLLVGGTRMLHGVTNSREVLFKALEHEFKIAQP